MKRTKSTKLSIDMLRVLNTLRMAQDYHGGDAYLEVGRYKPFSASTVRALQSRGFLLIGRTTDTAVYARLTDAGRAALLTGVGLPSDPRTMSERDLVIEWDEAEAEHDALFDDGADREEMEPVTMRMGMLAKQLERLGGR